MGHDQLSFEMALVPVQALDGVADRVLDIAADFQRAGSGWDVAEHLSTAFDALRRSYSGSPISVLDRKFLSFELIRARQVALRDLPADYPRAQIRAGFRALAYLVWFWGEPAEDRAKHPAGAMADARAVARLLQNDLFNLSLLNEMAARASERLVDDELAAWRVGLR